MVDLSHIDVVLCTQLSDEVLVGKELLHVSAEITQNKSLHELTIQIVTSVSEVTKIRWKKGINQIFCLQNVR